MDITPIIPSNYNVITGYSKGSFLINDIRHNGNIIVSKDSIWSWELARGIESLASDEFKLVIDDFKDKSTSVNAIILVGCGEFHKTAPFKLVSSLVSHNLSIDMMTTNAACRTYNILLAEGREVYAALLAL